MSGSKDGFVRLWDRSTLQLCKPPCPSGWACSAAFTPDGKAILVGTHHDGAVFCDPTTGKIVAPGLVPACLVSSVAFSPDGKMVVTARGIEGKVEFWDAERRHLLDTWPSPSLDCWATFYSDGSRVLLVSGGLAQVWDVAARQVVGPTLFRPEGGIGTAVFSPDGGSVLITRADRLATRLWDVTTGKTLGRPLLRDHANVGAFCRDGKMLAAGSADGRIVLWEIPEPLGGTFEQLRLQVEVFTCLELDDQETLRELSPEAVEARRERLHQALESIPERPSLGLRT